MRESGSAVAQKVKESLRQKSALAPSPEAFKRPHSLVLCGQRGILRKTDDPLCKKDPAVCRSTLCQIAGVFFVWRKGKGLFDVQEVADRLVDRLDKRKSAVVFFEDILKFHDLPFVDDAYEHVALRVAVSARRGDARGSVPQLGHDFPLDLFRVRRDDQEFISGFRTLDDRVADHARHQTVQHAQADRLIVVQDGSAFTGDGIDEVRNGRDGRIHGKVDPKKVEQRVLLADILCNDVHARRGRIAAEHDPVHKAAHRSRNERREDGIHVLCIVLEGSQIELLQEEQRARIDEAEDEGLDGKPAVDQEKGEQTERHVDDQGKVPDAESAVRHIFQHGGDAVDAGRRKLVGRDEEFVVERKYDGERCDQQTVAEKAERSLFVYHVLPPPLL